ncbi:sensor domain-containing protein [Mycolicibacter arupensis]|uniref:LppR n=1 Tax=Mycolicibacter arupensis TaxID=342002 RepID=A0A0F5N501_9MYCO|nr:sensor domain-containing protein [Mycolicibacter arupensis]KKC01353.1 lppR [Mycolicibacter arupensis]MCV7276918.1 sensor domain-containing protein [Mycolicibacter arupensis]ORA00851.1 sensor domain-containing protein [Mycolicibacter arupensis]
MAARAGAVAAGVAAISLLTGGCTTVVAGTVRPAPGLAPTPVEGMAVRQVLLDDSELSKLTGQPFHSDPSLPPRYGGLDDLPDAWESADPPDCVGAAVGGQRSVYSAASVRDVAHEFWDSASDEDSSLTGVAEAVIALASASDADALFEKFADQWKSCDGVVVTRDGGTDSEASGEITDVSDQDSVLVATVRTSVDDDAGLRVSRALATRVNCVVDVDVFWFVDEDDDPSAPPEGETAAADLARAMLDKVRNLSG